MALTTVLSSAAASAAADAVTALLAGGYLRIYNGSQPASPNVALTTQVLLAELRFGTPAFGPASNGVATATALTADASANADGTAAWCRLLRADGVTAVIDGSVGTANANLVLNKTAIVAGGQVSVTALTYTADPTEA